MTSTFATTSTQKKQNKTKVKTKENTLSRERKP